jgi:putative transposase
MLQRSYKYRFYPTDSQKIELAKTFGCTRFIYNWGLRIRSDSYHNNQENVYYKQLSARLTQKKKELVWLGDVSSATLQQSLRNLDTAFSNFFQKRSGYPKFKAKHKRQTARYTSNAFTVLGDEVRLAKMAESLNIVWSRKFSGTPTSATVSKDPANRYYISFQVEEAIPPLPETDKRVGIDLGIKDVVITSDGVKFKNRRFFGQYEKKLAHAQRELSRKRKGSRNRQKARLRVARINAKIADRRLDFQHKLTTQLIRENQTICVEDLSVKNMLRNRCLSKAIADVGWGEIVRQLQYKAEWYGRNLVKIDKWYPSSKRCSACGYIMTKMPLSIRSWRCPECKTEHDRDINASKNILAAGTAVLAFGEAIRPTAHRARLASVN